MENIKALIAKTWKDEELTSLRDGITSTRC
jgi:hypothetical protein